MFTQIKTSKENKEVVSRLTRRLNLGTENIIARIAFTYSLSKDHKLDLKDLKDAGGKEYSKAVLFGEYYDIYLGLLCTNYRLYKTDKDLVKYIKMHVDYGLELINHELNENPHWESFEYIVGKISCGFVEIEKNNNK